MAIVSQNIYVRLPYDAKIHWMNHKTTNPITGTPWYFISDPTHVFKKLRNNLSKSHVGEGKGRNIREIMIDGKEVSWRHIQGVYDYSCRNLTAKITRLTKRHVYLTSWSKMRVDLANQTLSKEVEEVSNKVGTKHQPILVDVVATMETTIKSIRKQWRRKGLSTNRDRNIKKTQQTGQER